MTPEDQQLLQTVIEKALSAHEVSRPFDWGRLLESGLGTAIGGLIAVVTLWLQFRFSFRAKLEEEKRLSESTAQQWFENEYIDRGVMALYERILRINSRSLKALVPEQVAIAMLEGDDSSALRRCQELLGENVIGIWNILERMHTVYYVDKDERSLPFIRDICALLMDDLPKLRDALVGCKVSSKVDVQALKAKPAVISICSDFESRATEIFKNAKEYLDSRPESLQYLGKPDPEHQHDK